MDDKSIDSPVRASFMVGEAMMVYSLNFWSWEKNDFLTRIEF